MKFGKIIQCILFIICLMGCSLSTGQIESENTENKKEVTSEEGIITTESGKVYYVQSIIRVNDHYYTPAGKSSIYLLEGYEKSGEVIYSDKEELPQENFAMVPKAEETRIIYENQSDDQYIYIEVPYLDISGEERTELSHYVCYGKEDKPEIFAEPLEGFPVYVCVDGKIFYPDSGSWLTLEKEIRDSLKKVGMIEHCDENGMIEQDGYGGQERYLGAVIYKEESTGNYYMNMADRDLWIALMEGTQE